MTIHRTLQVTVQSGQGMVARHQSSRILDVDPALQKSSARSSGLKTRTIPPDKGLRIDFDQDSVDYFYMSESVDCAEHDHEDIVEIGQGPNIGCRKAIENKQTELSNSAAIVLKDYMDHRELKSEPQNENFHGGFMVDSNLPSPQAVCCPTSLSTRAGVKTLTGYSTSKESDARFAISGVNFMLAANIRTLAVKGMSNLSAAPRMESDQNFQQSWADCHRAHHRAAQVALQQKQEGASEKAMQKLNGFLPKMRSGSQLSLHDNYTEKKMYHISNATDEPLSRVKSGNMTQPEECIRERNVDISIKPYTADGEDQTAPLQQQLASQQRQIEALQAALHAMQSRIVPFGGQDGDGGKVNVDTLTHTTSPRKQAGTSTLRPAILLQSHSVLDVNHIKASDETPLSSNSNSSFINAVVSASTSETQSETGRRTLITKAGQMPMPPVAYSSLIVDAAVRHAVATDPECISNERTRCGGRRDSTLCIFEDELSGSLMNSQYLNAGAFRYMSYPGAAPREHLGISNAERDWETCSEALDDAKTTPWNVVVEAKTADEDSGFKNSNSAVTKVESLESFLVDTTMR